MGNADRMRDLAKLLEEAADAHEEPARELAKLREASALAGELRDCCDRAGVLSLYTPVSDLLDFVASRCHYDALEVEARAKRPHVDASTLGHPGEGVQLGAAASNDEESTCRVVVDGEGVVWLYLDEAKASDRLAIVPATYDELHALRDAIEQRVGPSDSRVAAVAAEVEAAMRKVGELSITDRERLDFMSEESLTRLAGQCHRRIAAHREPKPFETEPTPPADFVRAVLLAGLCRPETRASCETCRKNLEALAALDKLEALTTPQG